MTEPLVVGGHRYDKVHLIVNADASNAGFCALMTFVLNGVRRAHANNWLPVVRFDRDNCPFFYERERGEDVWDYYFEPVLEVSYAQVQGWLSDGSLHESQVHVDDWRHLLEWHHSDPGRIATFWAKDTPADPNGWMAEKRALGREYVARFIKVKPHIVSAVDQFVARHMGSAFTFGAHVRGTDFAYASPTPPEAYFAAIDAEVARRRLSDFRVFLATDQQQFVGLFGKRYGQRLLTYDSFRSTGEIAPFRMSAASPYKKGEDVLIDTLLLSRTRYLLKGAAAGGEYGLWFNETLECTDFALGSAFDSRKYHQLESAYLKLNVDDQSAFGRKWRRAKGMVVQYVRSSAVATLVRRAILRARKFQTRGR